MNSQPLLPQIQKFVVTPGYIDVVPPWQIHQEKNGAERTIGFIVRSQRSSTLTQYRFDTATAGSARMTARGRSPSRCPEGKKRSVLMSGNAN
jgi:hypothetical protein